MKIIIDLHAAPSSQNSWEHGSSRDGSQEWGKTDENIQQTASVIEFLTARYIIYETIYTILYVTHDPCVLTYNKIYS